MSTTQRFVAVAALVGALGLHATRVSAAPDAASSAADRQSAREILRTAGLEAGLVVHIDCGDGALTLALHEAGGSLVHGLDTDADQVARARDRFLTAGVYGTVSVERFDGRRLPYAGNLVNLIVAEDPADVPLEEADRVLAPGGVLLVRKDGDWVRTVKPRPANIDEWTHYLHDSSGNPVAHDAVVGPPGHLQWTTTPRYTRSHEHIPGIYALVSTGNRLFYIQDEAPIGTIKSTPVWTLVARDAFNGLLLWKTPLEQWFPHIVNWGQTPPHLQRRLVAVEDRVYVTLGLHAPVSILDAATGKVLQVLEDSEGTEEILWHEGRLLLVIRDITEESLTELTKWRGLVSARRSAVDARETAEPLVKRLRASQNTGKRSLAAIDAQSGKPLWRRDDPTVHGIRTGSLSALGDRVLYQTGRGMVCLALTDGKEQWTSPAPRLRLAHGDRVYCADGGKVTALSVKTGEEVWSQKPLLVQIRDAFVAGGSLWLGGFKPIEGKRGPSWGPYFATQRDLSTGKVLRHVEPENPGHHHRCYQNKATDRYILAGRRGTEFIDLETGDVLWHSWARGVCRYGVLPANGLLYTPPHACGCYVAAKLTGFNALAPLGLPDAAPSRATGEPEPERGPAWGSRPSSRAPSSSPSWPTYRGDPRRSGSTTAPVPGKLALRWKTKIADRITPPVLAEGRLYVATTETHGIVALDSDSGRVLWRFTAGGRIDSPPTVRDDRVLFGCRDGYLYSLRAADGGLVWRLRAARSERRIVSAGQLESVSPVHGSVLAHDGVLYCTAGRSSYLDGGIDLLRVDPDSGVILSRTSIYSPDPETGRQPKQSAPSAMPGARSDILSSDGDHVYLRDMVLDPDGQRMGKGSPHLFTLTDYLDDSWTHRSYWIFGRECSLSTGCSGRARDLIYGRLLAFDDATIYGYGRNKVHWSNQLEDGSYRVFAVGRTDGAQRWTQTVPVQARAMLLADERLFLAGLSCEGAEHSGIFTTPEGDRPARLIALSVADGQVRDRYPLASAPVFDGLAASAGSLYIALETGEVACLAQD